MKVSHALGLVIVGYLAYTVWWKGAAALAKAVAAPQPLVPGAPAPSGNGVIVRGPDGSTSFVPAPSKMAQGLRSALSPTTGGGGGCPDCHCPGCSRG